MNKQTLGFKGLKVQVRGIKARKHRFRRKQCKVLAKAKGLGKVTLTAIPSEIICKMFICTCVFFFLVEEVGIHSFQILNRLYIS